MPKPTHKTYSALMLSLRDLIMNRMGGYANVGRVLGCSRQEVHNWVAQKKPIPLTRAFQLEIITNGKIRVKDMCPEFIDEIDRVRR